MRVSLDLGVPPVIIQIFVGFSMKYHEINHTSYWGTPMTSWKPLALWLMASRSRKLRLAMLGVSPERAVTIRAALPAIVASWRERGTLLTIVNHY